MAAVVLVDAEYGALGVIGAAVRFAFQEAEERRVPLEAVTAWRCPAHETTGHPPLSGEPARFHGRRATETLEAALRDVAVDHLSVELRRRVVEGPARKVLRDAPADADLLVVGARRRQGGFGLRLGRVAHAALHRAACPFAVVPQGL